MIVHADILTWAAAYDGPLFHALLCDPPYHLVETVKRFGKADAAPPKGDIYARAARGFMGKTWDGGDIAYRSETWAALASLLYPGAFLFAFAGTRGYHRMACAIEDAGLIIHPAIGWAFGSGFPKATRIDTQVDRRAGVERTKIATRKHQPKFDAAGHGYREKDNGYNSKARETFDVTAPATPLAEAWQGHRYGGQVLKPAFEFICVAQVPYQGRPVECITRTGAGALNIDGGRIGTEEDTARRRVEVNGAAPFGHGSLMGGDGHQDGRWPANLVLSHSPECNGACAPDCPVRRLGEQSGELSSGSFHNTMQTARQNIAKGAELERVRVDRDGDTGTAARFFFNADFMAERLEAADQVIYEAKADRSEREAGLDPRQVRLINSAAFEEATINDGRQKSIDNPYQRGETTRRNTHPTIKPISLARHLATLLLPPDLYAPRRLLVPFSGAGSEMIGALLAGWEEIVGVELEADHVRIAEARLAYWQQRKHEFLDPSKPITAALADVPDGQLELF